MTTVAWDGKLLVADTQATANGAKAIAPTEKLFIPGCVDTWTVAGAKVLVFGVSGDGMAPTLLKELLSNPGGLSYKNPMPPGMGSFTSLLITDHGVYRFAYRPKDTNGPSTQLLKINGKDAIGSGSGYAEAIMSLGYSAILGVRGASNVDISTGGDLRVWNLDSPEVIETIKN